MDSAECVAVDSAECIAVDSVKYSDLLWSQQSYSLLSGYSFNK